MIKSIAIVIVVALGALLVYAASRPDSFRIERSASIKAPPEKVYALINDLKRFNTWNPYERKDPAIKGSYSGPVAGKGAAYAWESDKVGVGRMQITDTRPAQKVIMDLDFVKPLATHNVVEFDLQPQGEATRVTWAMHGPSPYLSKLIGIFFDMDVMVGADFAAGLANLKTLAEQ